MMSGIQIDREVFPHADDLHPVVFHLLRRLENLLPVPQEECTLPDYYERPDGVPVYVWNREGLHKAALWVCEHVCEAFVDCEKCGEQYFPASSLPRVMDRAKQVVRSKGYPNLATFRAVKDGERQMAREVTKVQQYYAQCGCER